jgi:hypothetical protein
MTADRKTLLQRRANAQAAVQNPDLPPELREQFKSVSDKADVLLGLMDALRRKREREAAGLRIRQEAYPGD